MEDEIIFRDEDKDKPLGKQEVSISSIVLKGMIVAIILACAACTIQYIGAEKTKTKISEISLSRARMTQNEDTEEFRYYAINMTSYVCGFIVFVGSMILLDISMIKKVVGKVVEKRDKDLAYCWCVVGSFLMLLLLVIITGYNKMDSPKHIGVITFVSWPAITILNFMIFTFLTKKKDEIPNRKQEALFGKYVDR